MNPKPLVSIITPSYNQGKFIEDTILSVKNQDYPYIEHIVIDGQSKDNTLKILEKYENRYNLQWISEPDKGQAEAINKGFKMSKGRIISWLNSDDTYLTRDVITRIVNAFLQNPRFSLIYGNRVIIDEKNHLKKLQYSKKFDYKQFLNGKCPFCQQSTFFRQEIIKEYQLDPKLQFVMDTEYWLKIAPSHHFKYLNTFIGCFRLHSSCKSISNRYINKWNQERKYLNKKYGLILKNKKIFSFSNILFRIKRLFRINYRNYYKVAIDVLKILSIPKEQFAFPIKINKIKTLKYIFKSFILL